MENLYAQRMNRIPRSFVRETLKIIDDPKMISFAGGLPHPQSFPVEEIKESAVKVLQEQGKEVLQYSSTEGYSPLREYISQRYYKQGLRVDPEEILITNGSQQCLDLVGKVFLNKDDGVLLERPTYLAAIQAFGLYEPEFYSVPLEDDGPDVNLIQEILMKKEVKLFYAITNFQNPTGITYSKKKRRYIAKIFEEQPTLLVDDNPYGDIRFHGDDIPPIKSLLPESVLFGTFSKIIAPGLRMGWLVAPREIMDKLVIAKQASDLHSNLFTQRVIYQYLQDNDVDEHIQKIKKVYGEQRELMVQMIQKYFPEDVSYTKPEGGMFLWVTLPSNISSLRLFENALKENVAFIPGEAFYTDHPAKNTLRLNFSNSNPTQIQEGIKRLGTAIKKMI